MQKTFLTISDPGHGWCKVPLHVLAELRIIEAITYFSYMRKGFAYLEEDCDLSAFVAAYREETGCSPVFKELCSSNNPSRIRNYEGYTPSRAAEEVLKQILNHSLHFKIRDRKEKTIQYLSGLIPGKEEHLLMRFLQSEGRLETVHIGQGVIE